MSFEIIPTPDFARSAQPPPCTIRRGRSLWDVDGGLIGGAALKVADFKGIIDAFNA